MRNFLVYLTFACVAFLATYVSIESQILFAQENTANVLGKKDIEKIAKLMKDKAPIIWVFTGDSITHGCHHLHGMKTYPGVCEECIRWESGNIRFRDIFINTGISGNRTPDIVGDYEHRIGRWKPTVVSIKLGMNDALRGTPSVVDFEKNLEKLVKKARQGGAIVVLQTTNTSKRAPDRAKLDKYMDATRQVAKKLDVILVDNYAHWLANDAEAMKSWFNDPIHPNGRGQIEIAHQFLKTIGLEKNFNAYTDIK